MTVVSSDAVPAQVWNRAITGRLMAGGVALVYTALMLGMYVSLSAQWDYLGFWYRPLPLGIDMLIIGSTALPAMLLPQSNLGLVGYSKWLLYYTLMVPALLIPPHQGILADEFVITLWFTLWFSFSALLLRLREGKPFPAPKMDANIFWTVVLVIFVGGHITIFLAFRDTLNLASFDEVYSQRADATASVDSRAILYLLSNLAAAVNPFIIISGLKDRRYLLVAAGFAGQVLLYATIAGKIILASTLVMVSVYFLFDREGRLRLWRLYAGIVGVGVAGWYLVPRVSGGVASELVDVIYMRTTTLPGVLVGVYSDFFSKYPVTYLSHSLAGALFYDYPYSGESVGQVVGRYVTPGNSWSTNNYNANFVAADGIAGFGTFGIPLVILLYGIMIWFASKLVGDRNRAATCATMTPFLMALSDASLFTTLLTGGGALVLLLLYLSRGLASEDPAEQANPDH